MSAGQCWPRAAPAGERAAGGEEGKFRCPDGWTPHELRHAFASVLVALGCDPSYVIDQPGQSSAAFKLRVYRRAMGQDRASRNAPRELVGGADWAAA
jgi:integrase